MDPQLLGQCAQTITVAPAAGSSSAGDPTYGAQTAYAARVEQITKMLRQPDGNFKATTHWISTTAAIGLNDRIWLPGALTTDNTQARLPLSVESFPDERGNVDHYEVMV